MIIALNAGHTLTGKGTGAVGKIVEQTETRKVAKIVTDLLQRLGHTVINCTIDQSTNYLGEAVGKANAQKVDVAVSIHFNSSPGANGTEVLVYNTGGAPAQAKTVLNEIVKLGFRNRGIKERPDLYWLKHTSSKAMLIECCFVDDPDASKYNLQKMAEAIVLGLVGKLPSGGGSASNGGSFQIGDLNKTVEITASELNVRTGRGVTDKNGNENKVIGQLHKGDRVVIWTIDKAPDGGLWGSFRYNPDYVGFINMAHCKLV